MAEGCLQGICTSDRWKQKQGEWTPYGTHAQPEILVPVRRDSRMTVYFTATSAEQTRNGGRDSCVAMSRPFFLRMEWDRG